MKKSLITFLVVLTAMLVANVGAEPGQKWFDMENCAFCVSVTAEKGLMENMKTEYYNTKNGVVSVTVVHDDYREAMVRVQKGMQVTSEKIEESGKMPSMCGHCTQYGEFMMAGCTPEHVSTMAGELTIFSSDDPAMVEKLQTFAKRNNEEMKKMMMEAKKSASAE